MPRNLPPLRLAPLLLLLATPSALSPSPARAESAFTLPLTNAGRQPDIVDRWSGRILASRADVGRGDFATARRAATAVIKDMLARIEKGTTARLLLGSAAYVRAIAEMGEGKDAEATWDVAVAFALAPELRGYDPVSEGVMGEKVLEALREEEQRFGGEPPTEDTLGTESEVAPPKRLEAPRPRYPEGKRRGRVQAAIAVRIVIDSQGQVHLPTLLEGDDPSLIYSGFEALRKWRFEPARAGGEPVTVWYKLTINYALR